MEALNFNGIGIWDSIINRLFAIGYIYLTKKQNILLFLLAEVLHLMDEMEKMNTSKPPSQKIIEGALKMKEKGICRFIGLTGHNRKLFPELRKQNVIDLFHIRYNAVHRGAETETFPFLQGENRPGVVIFTATSWGQLLNAKKMPPGESPPTAIDCYRFVLSNPAVDVCLTAPKTIEQMRQNLAVLDLEPMSPDELERMRRIGDHI